MLIVKMLKNVKKCKKM